MTRLLQEWPRRQAEVRPEATAVALDDRRLTYGELEARSNRLARALRESGCRRGDRVCLLAPKSPEAIAGMLGALKADAAYVPLDPAGPAARLARIVERCETPWLLAAPGVGRLLGQLLDARPDLRCGWLGAEPPADDRQAALFGPAELASCSPEPPASVNRPDDPAHLLFTSGSTGEPKGVVITHANVVHFVRWAVEYFGIGPEDRVSGHPPFHFDLSTFDIYGAFAAGAQLHLVPPERSLLPHRLAEFIRAAELTQWFSVPSLLGYMARFDVLRPGDFPALKRLLWCGEVFPTPALRYWMERLPHAAFTNLYGPTEATIASSYYTVPACPRDDREAVPIGRPCPGEELLVLDEALRPVSPGEEGELYLRGVGLSPGYWRDPEKTAAAFLPDPWFAGGRLYRTGDRALLGWDGLFHFLGRADGQIKSRGHRIELGEVEAAVGALPGLAESAVVAVESGSFEGMAICCAYAPAAGMERSPAALRKELERALPGYMLPARWLELPRLPRNANGKIDRRQLHEWFAAPAAEEGSG